ncbi:MAG: ATP-binding protein, partial [Bacteroidetes bacterium]
SVEFLYLPDNDVYLSVRGNDALLKSAFRNLIKNAYQYSEDRTVQITIEANESSISIHFENQGKQISDDDQVRLFIPFFRGQNAQRKKGFGLGLSIVKRIIVLHQGTIDYTPINTERNKFSICFLKQDSSQASAAIDALLNSR